jgi:capsular exopolysaccharide synthesis family protein
MVSAGRETIYNFYKELELKDYIEVMTRRKKIVITFFLCFVLIAAIHSVIATPIYRATTQLLIERETPKVLTIEELYAVGGPASDYYQTQYKVLQSRSLAERVVNKLNLTVSPRFRMGNPAMMLLRMIEIEPVRNSRLVDIHAYSDNPQLAATIANALSEQYIEKNLDDKYGASRRAVDWLSGEIDELRIQMEEAEKKLQEYKEDNQLVSLEESQNIIVQKLAELNSKATNAKATRLTAEAKYSQMEEFEGSPDSLETLSVVRDNGLIRGLKQNHATKEGELSELLKRYKEKHPKIIELRSEINALTERIYIEIAKIVNGIRTEYEEAKMNEEAILLALTEQEKRALELNRLAIEYGVLKREAETNRDVFESYLKKMKETDIARELKPHNIRIVDTAKIPTTPVKPRKMRNLLLACLLGLFVGGGCAFTLEYFDDSIRNQKDIEAFIQAPFLGYVPVVKEKPQEVGLYSFKHPHSEAGEALRSIKTNINFILPEAKCHTLLITSAIPQEGKTSVTSNFGIVLAQSGSRVLLVDCDMRHPTLHKTFKLDNSVGLRDYLSDMKNFETVVQQTLVTNLSVIPCGPIPHNPMELLDSPQMSRLIEEAHDKFDKIIIDSPPVIAVSDALILAKLANGIIQVVRGGRTSREIVLNGKNKFDAIGFNLLGVLLNNLNLHKEKYYYTYYYYHGEKVKKRRRKKERTPEPEAPTGLGSKGEGSDALEVVEEPDIGAAPEIDSTNQQERQSEPASGIDLAIPSEPEQAKDTINPEKPESQEDKAQDQAKRKRKKKA